MNPVFRIEAHQSVFLIVISIQHCYVGSAHGALEAPIASAHGGTLTNNFNKDKYSVLIVSMSSPLILTSFTQ
jgi:hypothetical protein